MTTTGKRIPDEELPAAASITPYAVDHGRVLRRRPAEAINLFWTSLIFLGLGLLALFVPKAISLPFGVIAVWFAVAGLFQAWRLYAHELYVHETESETAERIEDRRKARPQGSHRHA